jgi:hypothetical protein
LSWWTGDVGKNTPYCLYKNGLTEIVLLIGCLLKAKTTNGILQIDLKEILRAITKLN